MPYRIIAAACLFLFFACKRGGEEIIFFNGKIFTADTLNLYAEAVAIRDDKIIAVGSWEEVIAVTGKNAKQVDLEGNCLLPGLVDSHIHVLGGGQTMVSAHLEDVFESYLFLEKFAEESYRNGKSVYGKYIMITGLNQLYFNYPDSLAAIFNKGEYLGKPVFLRDAYGHTAWINDELLNERRIDQLFLNKLSGPQLQFYGSGKDNNPNGILHEDPAFEIFSMIQDQAKEKNAEAALAGIRYCNSLGITAMLDPRYQNPVDWYKVVADKGLMTAHMNVCIKVDPEQNITGQLSYVDSLRKHLAATPNLKIAGIKVFADGVAEIPAQTAAMSKPYLNTGKSGELLFEQNNFTFLLKKADSAGLAVHVHAIGDRAISETLDGFEEFYKAGNKSNLYHTIAHLQFVNPADIDRFRKNNLIASFQFKWAEADTDVTDLIKPFIDPVIYEWQYPAYSMSKAGVIVTAGSDWPVTTPNPFEAMYVGETRRDDMDIVLNEKEKMPRLNLLFAYTRDAAKALNMEKKIGTIEKGKQADFVLVDRDVTTVSPEELKKTKVVWTMFGGKIVYSATNSGKP